MNTANSLFTGLKRLLDDGKNTAQQIGKINQVIFEPQEYFLKNALDQEMLKKRFSTTQVERLSRHLHSYFTDYKELGFNLSFYTFAVNLH